MTPTTLAELYIRAASDAAGEKAPARKDRDTVLSLALLMACQDVLIHRPGGSDRSATLARAADAKRAEGPAHL